MHLNCTLFLLLFSLSAYSMGDECKQESPKRPPVAPISLADIALSKKTLSVTPVVCSYSPSIPMERARVKRLEASPETETCSYALARFDERYNAAKKACASATPLQTPSSPEMRFEQVKQEIKELAASPNVDHLPDATLRFNERFKAMQDHSQKIDAAIIKEQAYLKSQQEKEIASGWCCMFKNKK